MQKDNSLYQITFETQCWENDWEFLLKTNYLDRQIKNCNYDFVCKQLIINNVKNKKLVEYYAQKKIDAGIIDKFYFAEDYIDDCLKFFKLSKTDLGKGYYYSTAALVGLYLSKTAFHLHFSGDSFLPKSSDWISESSVLLAKNPQYLTANPIWNYANSEARKEAQKSIENFYVGYGFSDQCYLVRTADFRQPIYNSSHPASERYPKYGGELFEKRVDSFMRNNEKLRLIYKQTNYVHANFPKSYFFRQLNFIFLKLNIYFLIKPIEAKILTLLKKNFSSIKRWIIKKINKKI